MAWPKSMPIVEVKWIDSAHTNGWQHVEDMDSIVGRDDMRCITSGYLFREYENRIVIVQSVAEVGNVGDAMTIPRVAIIELTVVKEAAE